ncbi:hypothetical protein [Streptomyces longwoodensis]|uniref:hypothetical protein n=1 Tax=Streptomyces longwoodensis TaxID=68231 RepID=UPI00340ACC5B
MSDLGARSWRSVAWRVAIPVLIFAGSTALVMTLRFSWTPRSDSDRWAVAMVVAVFLSGLAVSTCEWIRSSGSASGGDPSRTDRQEVTTGRDSENIVARGDVGVAGTDTPRPAGRRGLNAPLDQKVRSGRRSRNIVAGGNVGLPPEKRE